MEKDDEETEEKWRRRKGGKRKMIKQWKKKKFKENIFSSIKCHFLNLEAPYLITLFSIYYAQCWDPWNKTELLVNLHNVGTWCFFGKHNDFAYDILSYK